MAKLGAADRSGFSRYKQAMSAAPIAPSPTPPRRGPGARPGSLAEGRLAAAIAVSLAIHLLLLGALARRPTATAGPLVAARLELRLTSPQPSTASADARPAPQPAVATPPALAAPDAAPPETPLSTPPRFAEAPDFAELETMSLSQPLRLKLRIHVAAVGRATRVEVLETRLVPAGFLAGIVARLEQARYQPGRAGETAVDSAFELVIEAAPQFEPGNPGEMPRQ